MNKKRILMLNAFFLSFLFLISLSSPAAANVNVFVLDLPELKIEMMSLEWDDPSPLAAEYLKETLEDIGIKIIHKPLDDTVMYPLIYSGGRYSEPLPDGMEINHTRLFYTYEMSDSIGPTPQHLYWELHSSQDYPWGSNHCFFKNATMDQALEDMNSATNELELKSALNTIQEIMADEAPLIPLFLSSDSHIINKKWVNFCNMSGGLFTAYNRWTMINMSATDGDKEFHMAYPGSGISHLNPFLYVDARSSWAAMLHHDTLLTLDANYNLAPWVAEKWEKSADATQLNFTLRSGVKFHDGTDVTPDDVKHSIEFTMGAKASPRYSGVEKVENVTIDGNVIVVNFLEPYAFAEYDIGLADTWILPKSAWEGQDYDDPDFDLVAATADKVGCGPYEYVGGVELQSWTFEKFDDYWYTGGPTMPNYTASVPLPVGDYPRIENVTIYVGGGSDSRLLGMQSGLYDTERYESYAIDIMDDIKAGTTAYNMLKVAEYPSEWLYKITFNTAIKPLDDVNVRRAIAYAIDRDACVDYARGGYGYPTYSWIPEVYYPNWHNPNIEKYPYNIEKAKEILENAGYIDVDGDGIRECPGHYILPTETSATSTTEATKTKTKTKTKTEGPSPGFLLVFAIVALVPVIYHRKRKR